MADQEVRGSVEAVGSTSAAGNRSNEDVSQETVTLRRPVDFEGRRIERIELDFDRLTGAAMRRAERRFVGQGGTLGMDGGVSSNEFCACCAAEISGLPLEAFDVLSAVDYAEVATVVRLFLSGLPVTPEGLAGLLHESEKTA